MSESGYNAHITDTTTGATRTERMDLPWNEFWWREGNYACDCNRGTAFARAGGEDTDALTDEEDDERFPCGRGRFVVRITSDSGAVLYQDCPSKEPSDD